MKDIRYIVIVIIAFLSLPFLRRWILQYNNDGTARQYTSKELWDEITKK